MTAARATGITINGEYVAAAAAATKISVDVVWEELSFTYQDGDKTWDPTKHQDVVAEGAWEDTKKTITVTNHSNVGIRQDSVLPVHTLPAL